MLTTIKQFFDKYMAPSEAGTPAASEHALQLATAALLIEMTRMDEEVNEKERAVVIQAIQSKFDLTPEETSALIQLAQTEAQQATDYHQFTSLINKGFTPEQKIKIIEHLWQVAYADGRLHRYEDHLVRKIADLLYVSHKDFIMAKHRVRQALPDQPD